MKCVTVEDFKELFTRNFPYLPLWDSSKTYFIDEIVYEEPNFYISLKDNNTAELTDDTSWQVANINIREYITDGDIENAWREAEAVFNPALAHDKCLAFLYLVAFYLAYDLSVVGAGAMGNVTFPVTSVTVGSVSESYYVPKVYAEDPILSFYARNGFGLKYLEMIYPNLIGNVGVVAGWSLP